MKTFYSLLFIITCQLLNAQIQIGETIYGEVSSELLGNTTAISNDGSIIAIGVERNDENGANAGQVKVYKNINDSWVQLGNTLYGNQGDYFGNEVALSSDGTILAVAANNSIDYNLIKIDKCKCVNSEKDKAMNEHHDPYK